MTVAWEEIEADERYRAAPSEKQQSIRAKWEQDNSPASEPAMAPEPAAAFPKWEEIEADERFKASPPEEQQAIRSRWEADTGYQPKERGLLGDIGSHLYRGALDVAEHTGRAMQAADLKPEETPEEEGKLDRYGRKLTEWSEQKMKTAPLAQPDRSEAAGDESWFKQKAMEGVRSTVLSMAPMATAGAGFLAGGAMTGGSPVGAGAGAIVGGAAGVASLFGLATYHKKREELKDTDIPDEEKHAAARDYALIEAGGEAVADLVDWMMLKTGKVIGASQGAKNVTKATIRSLLKTPPKEIAKRGAMVYANEWGTETVQAKMQSDIDARTGLGEQMGYIESAIETAIPTAVMTLTFGAFSGGLTANERRKVKKDLNSDKVEDRIRAANRILGEIDDPEIARSWKDLSLDRIRTGGTFDLDENIAEYVRQQQEAPKPAGPVSRAAEIVRPTGAMEREQAREELDAQKMEILSRARNKQAAGIKLTAQEQAALEAEAWDKTVPPAKEALKPEGAFPPGTQPGGTLSRIVAEARYRRYQPDVPEGRDAESIRGDEGQIQETGIERPGGEAEGSPDFQFNQEAGAEAGIEGGQHVRTEREGEPGIERDEGEGGREGQETGEETTGGIRRPPGIDREETGRDAEEVRRAAGLEEPLSTETVERPDSIAVGQEVNTTPTEPMKEAENYKKAHVKLDGFDISVENPVGSVRSGKDKAGKEWSQEIKADYGYFKGSVGFDKDHVDTFIKPGYKGGAETAYIVNQVNPDGSFDEHKVVLGAESEQEAMEIYNSNYEEGWTGGKSVVAMPMEQFKEWVKSEEPKKGEVSAPEKKTAQEAAEKERTEAGVEVAPKPEELPQKPSEPETQPEDMAKFKSDLERKGVAVGPDGTTYSIQYSDQGGYYFRTEKDGIRIEKGGDLRGGGWTIEQARAKAIDEADFAAKMTKQGAEQPAEPKQPAKKEKKPAKAPELFIQENVPITTKYGTFDYLLITGNTKEHVARIKAAGRAAKWLRTRKAWRFPMKSAESVKKNLADLLGVATATEGIAAAKGEQVAETVDTAKEAEKESVQVGIAATEEINGVTYEYRIARIPKEERKDSPQLTHRVEVRRVGGETWESAGMGKALTAIKAADRLVDNIVRSNRPASAFDLKNQYIKNKVESELEKKKAAEEETARAEKEESDKIKAEFEAREKYLEAVNSFPVKGKKATLTIHTNDGPQQVDGIDYGDWYMHKAWGFNANRETAVSDAISGMMAFKGTKKDALSVVKALKKEGISLPFDARNRDSLAKNERKQLEEAASKAMEVVGFFNGGPVPSFVKTPQAAVPGAQQATEPAMAAKGIETEDAGAELAYNKRNRIKSGLKWGDIKDKDAALRVRETTKAKVYPKPDYDGLITDGMEPVVAHVIKQAYDAIAVKPRTRTAPTDENLQQYINAVNSYMDGVFKWAGDSNAVASWIRTVSQSARQRLGMMSGQVTSISSLAEEPGKTLLDIVYPDGWKNSRTDISIIGGNRALRALQPHTDEVVKAMQEIDKGWPKPQEAWQRRGYQIISGNDIEVGYYEGTDHTGAPYVSVWFKKGRRDFEQKSIDAKSKNDPAVTSFVENRLNELKGKSILVDKRFNLVGTFENEEQAREAAREAIKKSKKSPKIKDEGISVEAAKRIGKDRRGQGENVSSQKLMETFGFKGVNFGNWMKGKANEAERQLHLNHAYDSFLDLAEVLNIPPKAISLNGLLGIAIGAQGSGGFAAAHFVPGVNEINLTRTKGAGSLAHEWAHGLDHYFARLAGNVRGSEPFITEMTSAASENIRPEIVERFKKIVATMRKRPITEKERLEQIETREKRTRRNIDGWLAGIKSNTLYGVEDNEIGKEFDAIAKRISDLDLGDGKVQISRPAGRGALPTTLYPVVIELRELYKKAQGRMPGLDDYKALQANIDSLQYAIESKNHDEKHIPQVATTYLTDASKLDKEKGGKKYWSTSLEMFARAFDAYVSDRLEEGAISNTYLSHAGRTGDTVPGGYERLEINKAIDDLVSILKTKETDKGVTLYSTAPATFAPANIKEELGDVSGIRIVTPKEAQLILKKPAVLPDGRTINGFVRNGRVYLVQGHVTSGRAKNEAMHEISVHLRKLGMKSKTFQGLLDELYSHRGEDSDLGRAVDRAIMMIPKGTQEAHYKEEVMAYLVGNGRTDISLVRRFIARVKRWLAENMKLPARFFSQDDIQALAVMALRQGEEKRVAVGAAIPAGIRYAAAWHGSPHRFDRFSSEKIGTGEGAQAYGHGLYFSSTEEVADWYRRKLTRDAGGAEHYVGEQTLEEFYASTPLTRNVTSAERAAISIGVMSGRGAEAALRYYDEDSYGRTAEGRKFVASFPFNDVKTVKQGALYQVELAPAEDEYLLWDKPLSEQSEKVRKALEGIEPQDYQRWRESLDMMSPDELLKIANEIDRNNTIEDEWDDSTTAKEKIADLQDFFDYFHSDDPASFEEYVGGFGFSDIQSGQGIYQQLATAKRSDKAASEYLHSLGIRGIKYLDGTSRAKGEGDYNYVIFSDEDVEIVDVKLSAGTPIQRVTKAMLNSPSFRKWFGNSAFRTKSGDPIPVWHGTSDKGFLQGGEWVFNRQKGKGKHHSPLAGLGNFFALNRTEARGYTKATGVVRPFYVSVQNPLTINSWELNHLNTRDEASAFAKRMELRGHDGIFFADLGHVVVFDSGNIKSAEYQTGEWDRTMDDTRFSVGPAIKEAFDVPEQHNLSSTLKNSLKPGTITKEEVGGYLDATRTKLIDRLHPIKTLGPTAYKLHSLLHNAHAVFATFLHHGKLTWLDQALTVTEKDKGFLPWFHAMGEDGRKFFYWLATKRAEVLEGEERENWLTDDRREAIRDELFAGLSSGERKAKEKRFEQLNKEFQQFNNNVLDIAIEAGLITEEQLDSWTRDFYLPFYRIMEDQATREEMLQGPRKYKKHVSAQIRRLKGGEEKLGDPLENVLRNWFHLIQESQRNVARAEAAEVAVDQGLADEISKKELLKIIGSKTIKRWGIRRIGKDRVSRYFDSREEAEANLQKGYEIVEKRDVQVIFGRKEDFAIMSYQRDGQTVYLRVNDPALYDALTEVNAKAFESKTLRLMMFSKRLLTMGATFTPAFRIANMIRDTVHSFVVSRSFMPFVDTAKGFVKVWKESPEFVALMASGGGFGQGWVESGDPKAMAREISKIIKRETTAKGTLIDTPRKALDLWQKIGMASEMAARVQLYSNLRKKGVSHMEAAFEARDLLDFFKSGAGNSVRVLMAVSPFLNARVQGLDRLYRGVKQDKAAFMTKGALVAAASLMLWMLFKDDDRYKKLEDWEKWQYHHFWIGDMHYRIPKAFETGALFSTLFESLGNVLAGDEDWEFFGRFVQHTLRETFAADIPVFFGPTIEAYANKSAFTGRPIESMAQQRMKPGERANPWTPELLKDLGKITNISPVKAEHIIQGHTAAFGAIFLTIADAFYRMVIDAPARPAKRIQDIPGIGRFVRDDDSRTKYATRYYEFAREVNELVATVNNYKNIGEPELAKKIISENADTLRHRKMVGRVQRRLSLLRKREKFIWNSDLTPEQKRDELKKLSDRKNEIVRRAYEAVNQ